MTVYFDLNDNGQQDVSEPTAKTLTDDAATPGVDETGSYAFLGLEPGIYGVGQVMLAGTGRRIPRPSRAGSSVSASESMARKGTAAAWSRKFPTTAAT